MTKRTTGNVAFGRTNSAHARKVTLFLLWGATACQETPYELFAGGPGSSDGVTGEPPASVEECLAKSSSEFPLERLRATGSGLCVERGAATDLMGDPGYVCELAPCAEIWEQLWTIRVDGAAALEFRNEDVGMNLDVQYADSASGTPLVLYTAHPLYNQRFFVVPGPDDTFQLTPRHAQGQCVEALGTTLELQACNSLTPGQFFRRETCVTSEE